MSPGDFPAESDGGGLELLVRAPRPEKEF
jgi:hypothetical protein